LRNTVQIAIKPRIKQRIMPIRIKINVSVIVPLIKKGVLNIVFYQKNQKDE
jgi:hypothetical protein